MIPLLQSPVEESLTPQMVSWSYSQRRLTFCSEWADPNPNYLGGGHEAHHILTCHMFYHRCLGDVISFLHAAFLKNIIFWYFNQNNSSQTQEFSLMDIQVFIHWFFLFFSSGFSPNSSHLQSISAEIILLHRPLKKNTEVSSPLQPQISSYMTPALPFLYLHFILQSNHYY